MFKHCSAQKKGGLHRFLLRHQLALAFAFRFAHGLPLRDGLDLAVTIFAVGAAGAGLGLTKYPLVEPLLVRLSGWHVGPDVPISLPSYLKSP